VGQKENRREEAFRADKQMMSDNSGSPNDCVICGRKGENGVTNRRGDGGDTELVFDCSQCGQYQTDVRLIFPIARMWTLEERAGLSCATRQASEGGEVLRVTGVSGPKLAASHVNTRVADNMEKLLRVIVRRSGRPGAPVIFHQDRDFTVIDCFSRGEFEQYLHWIEVAGLILRPHRTTDASRSEVVLTMNGWNTVQPLPRPGGIPGRCFVAMMFDAEMNEVFDTGISPAVVDCGLPSPVRIDRKEHNNQITDEIIAGIRDAEFVIADFTGHRGGVYYEAGFARGMGRAVIYCCKDTDFASRHFDIQPINTIKWTDASDLRKKLIARIKATIIPKA
jgi:hypothetical protein